MRRRETALRAAFPEPPEPGTVVAHVEGSRVRLVVAGEFDYSNHHVITTAVRQALQQGGRQISVDAAGLAFIDVAAMRALLRCREMAAARHGDLRLDAIL